MNIKYSKTFKKASGVLLTLGLIASLSLGCQTSPYEQYKKAEEKTNGAKTGIYDMTLKMESDIDTSKLSEAELKSINYFKQFEIKSSTTEDKEKKTMISDAWVNLGGIGFDFTYYGSSDGQYIKYPVLKKYIDLNASIKNLKMGTDQDFKPTITKTTEESLSRIWSQLATTESVKSVGDMIIVTDAGDIKAKHMVIEVPGDAIKKAIVDSQKIIFLDPNIQKMMANQLAKIRTEAVKNGKSEAEIKAILDKSTNTFGEHFKIDSYVLSCDIDADGYVVQDSVDITMSGFGSDSPLKAMTFHMNTIYSSLDKPVTLNFPDIKPEQVFTAEELNQQMPSVFKDLIQ